jgi:hypothetical protein
MQRKGTNAMIPTYAHSKNYSQISTHIADLVCGTYDLDEAFPLDTDGSKDAWMTWSDRAHFMAALIATYNAMWAVGEIEHTNDWDWRINIVLTDGTTYGDSYEEEEEDVMIDTITSSLIENFPQNANPDTAATQYRGMGITIEIYTCDDEGKSTNVHLRLDQIHSITIERL